MDDLVTWLRAQLNEDEGLARTAFAEHNNAVAEWSEPWSGTVQIGPDEDDLCCNDSGVSRHIVNWDPARVLAEVEARRYQLTLIEALLRPVPTPLGYPAQARTMKLEVEAAEEHAATAMLRLLALPYADRPGYLREWRP